jgi:uncharacterized protein YbjT (DUF2867 family)
MPFLSDSEVPGRATYAHDRLRTGHDIPVILVTGPTGTIGGALLRHLTQNEVPTRALTRHPPDASDAPAIPPGVEVVYGDLDRPETLTAPATGVSALFLLTAPGPAAPARDLAMLAAARAAGVPRIVKLSAIGTAESDNAKVRAWHAPGEDTLRSGDAAWTVLRPSDLVTNTLSWANLIRAGRPVPNPTGAGARGVIDPRDVAEAAAVALTTHDHSSRVYTLTGPALLSVPAQAEILGQVLARTVTTEDIPPETQRARLMSSGRDPAFAEVAVDGAAFVRRGGAAILTRHVQTLTGHPARTFASWAEANRDAFA